MKARYIRLTSAQLQRSLAFVSAVAVALQLCMASSISIKLCLVHIVLLPPPAGITKHSVGFPLISAWSHHVVILGIIAIRFTVSRTVVLNPGIAHPAPVSRTQVSLFLVQDPVWWRALMLCAVACPASQCCQSAVCFLRRHHLQ